MANIQIKELKPQVATVLIKHPITGETIFDLPDGTKVELKIYMVGRNSKQWLEFMRSLKSNVSTAKEDLFSRISDSATEFVASLIVGWSNNGSIDVPYSPEAAKELLSQPENIWLLEQLQEALLNETNFFLTKSID
jgi:hypothetical protein